MRARAWLEIVNSRSRDSLCAPRDGRWACTPGCPDSPRSVACRSQYGYWVYRGAATDFIITHARSGYHHTSFSLLHESSLAGPSSSSTHSSTNASPQPNGRSSAEPIRNPVMDQVVPPGHLVRLLQKGLLYLEAEARYRGVSQAPCPFPGNPTGSYISLTAAGRARPSSSDHRLSDSELASSPPSPQIRPASSRPLRARTQVELGHTACIGLISRCHLRLCASFEGQGQGQGERGGRSISSRGWIDCGEEEEGFCGGRRSQRR